ncbi:hypothetical protein [Corynebacterium aquatimens]|uniref:Uncharacterized protein n=1 Tax=Corynebacterium aquatimens TaxID=1190508 RepID=A0A931E353_9CORY|nr:hypothetical protein [Corynebacterium aquatimens]MBG6121638.1 hypothetical protein [Corynebacterium aquatimens]
MYEVHDKVTDSSVKVTMCRSAGYKLDDGLFGRRTDDELDCACATAAPIVTEAPANADALKKLRRENEDSVTFEA